MESFKLLAQPAWVNFVAIVPFVAYFLWRRQGLVLSVRTLFWSAVFATAFGFVEAAVVVYLRAAIGFNDNVATLNGLSGQFLSIELFREAATLIMLATVAFLAVAGRRNRWAMFFWTFAIWDIAYYAGLWATVRWPQSLTAPDVLFLIPVPWLAPVWFPLLVSSLMLLTVLVTRRS